MQRSRRFRAFIRFPGSGLGSTRHNGWIRVRIDHVLTGPEWWTERAVVGRDEGSDHRPLIADLRLRR